MASRDINKMEIPENGNIQVKMMESQNKWLSYKLWNIEKTRYIHDTPIL